MTWDPDTLPAKCANGDGNPIAGETTTGTQHTPWLAQITGNPDDALTEDVDLLCAQCLEQANP